MDTYLEQLLHKTADAILISDAQGVIRFWNRGAELIFGHTPDEAVGQSLDLIIPEMVPGSSYTCSSGEKTLFLKAGQL